MIARLGKLALALAVLGSCLAAPKSKSPSEYRKDDSRKDEILALWMQVREWRVELGMRPAPPSPLVHSVIYQPTSQLRICREQPRTNTCSDVCSIKDNICDNAEEICRIANDLNGDDWAREKCGNAKASCREARERCCGCISREPPAEPESDTPAAPAGADRSTPEWP